MRWISRGGYHAHYFPCPYLGDLVELNEERERHIRDEHSELLPSRLHLVASTLADPDLVLRRETSTGISFPFCRWYDELGNYVIVAVVRDHTPRDWIVTAYIAGRLPKGETIWERN